MIYNTIIYLNIIHGVRIHTMCFACYTWLFYICNFKYDGASAGVCGIPKTFCWCPRTLEEYKEYTKKEETCKNISKSILCPEERREDDILDKLCAFVMCSGVTIALYGVEIVIGAGSMLCCGLGTNLCKQACSGVSCDRCKVLCCSCINTSCNQCANLCIQCANLCKQCANSNSDSVLATTGVSVIIAIQPERQLENSDIVLAVN